MTSSRSAEVERRRRGGAPRKPRSVGGALASMFGQEATRGGCGPEIVQSAWPSPRYREDPVGFFREQLGVEPWSRQIEVIEAVRDHSRVAVAGGHKVSKSNTIAGVALWFYESFDDARVILSSTTARQVDDILWRELRMMHARSGLCTICKARVAGGEAIARPCPHADLLDGELAEKARTGLRSMDFREIVGFTAREAEAVAGISGKNLLYIIDEASGVPQIIFEAIEGNRAGGARLLLFSQGTKNDGEFHAAFHEKSQFYFTLHISSEESPNVVEGREVVPGLATREWIDEKREEWGVESALYIIRVKGQFATREEGKICSVHQIMEAEKRWPTTEAEGRLHIGIDPAGPGLGGDESTFALRRGQKVMGVQGHRGLTEDGHLVMLLGLLAENVRRGELRPVVTIDREGPIGAKIYWLLAAYLEQFREEEQPFYLVGIRASDRAVRQPLVYDRLRDELWAIAALWLREGGAVPEDAKLAKEMNAPSWVPHGLTNRLKATPKDELRKILGRSPDRADAVILSVWEPAELAAREEDDDQDDDAAPALDVYAMPAGIDPYNIDGAT